MALVCIKVFLCVIYVGLESRLVPLGEGVESSPVMTLKGETLIESELWERIRPKLYLPHDVDEYKTSSRSLTSTCVCVCVRARVCVCQLYNCNINKGNYNFCQTNKNRLMIDATIINI